jgi:hypothetical protein
VQVDGATEGQHVLQISHPTHSPFLLLVLQVSHLLQKPIESVCGFLTVLPGAFCAFRWAAVEVRWLAATGRDREAGCIFSNSRLLPLPAATSHQPH